MASKVIWVAVIVLLLISTSLYFFTTGQVKKSTGRESTKLPVVIRVDDIQDFAFREAQLCIFKASSSENVPMSLSVIPKLFSADLELVEAVKDAIRNGSEVTAHGWLHENLTTFTMVEQELRLLQARKALKNVLGIEVTTLVPPLFEYNLDTLEAMKKAGYDTISSTRVLQNPGLASNGVMGLPSTVNFSDFVNDTWKPKGLQRLMLEVEDSVSMHGYAMVVIHPQELLNGGVMNQTTVSTFEGMLADLKGKYFFTTIGELANRMKNETK